MAAVVSTVTIPTPPPGQGLDVKNIVKIVIADVGEFFEGQVVQSPPILPWKETLFGISVDAEFVPGGIQLSADFFSETIPLNAKVITVDGVSVSITAITNGFTIQKTSG